MCVYVGLHMCTYTDSHVCTQWGAEWMCCCRELAAGKEVLIVRWQNA